MSKKYDISISFAGEDRHIARDIATKLKNRGITVFYDDFEKSDLWGKNLYEHFISIYRDNSKFCLMLLSKSYSSKLWTSHERKAAQTRAFKENKEYILPLKLDDAEVSGILETTGYIDFRKETADDIAELIENKLWGNLNNDPGLNNLKAQLEELYMRTMLVCELAFQPKNHKSYGKIPLAIQMDQGAKDMFIKLKSDLQINAPNIDKLILTQLTKILDAFDNILNRARFLINLQNPAYLKNDFICEIPEDDFNKIYLFLNRLNLFKNYDKLKKHKYTPQEIIDCWKVAEEENDRYFSNPLSYKRRQNIIPFVFNVNTLKKLPIKSHKSGDFVKTFRG